MKKVTIVGGDGRLRTVKNDLQLSGFTVDTLGLYYNDIGDLSSSDVVLLPVPVTRDSLTVFCPLTDRNVPLSEIRALDNHTLILCGNYRFEGKNYIDYCACDSYAYLNAVPTAEGAIAVAMEQTPYTLWRSRVLVIGYGRLAKVLCDRLCGLRCDVTVSARKQPDFALLDTLCLKHINSGSLNNLPLDYDIIFNTIDVPILDGCLERLHNTLLIDLSSKGGFDFEVAKSLGINCHKLPGLPGKVAPETAGQILSQTVINLIMQNT